MGASGTIRRNQRLPLLEEQVSLFEKQIAGVEQQVQSVEQLQDSGLGIVALRRARHTLENTLASASARELVVMFDNMAAIARITGALARQYDEDAIDHLVRAFMPGTVTEPADIKQRVMVAQARKAVMESGDWITAARIAELANFSTRNVSAQPNKWKKAGDIFAMSFNGQDYFPLYGLDPITYRPRKAMRSVIEKFSGSKDAWGLAYWFASVNGYLDGARPQDVLQTDPNAVLAAADAEIAPLAHG